MRDEKSLRLAVVVGSIALVAVAVTLFLVFRSTSTEDSRTGTDSYETMPDPVAEVSEPVRVGQSALSQIYAWNPAEEPSSWNALHRAAPLLGGKLAEAAATEPDPLPMGLQEWPAWARGRDQITAAVTAISPALPGTVGEVRVQYQVQQIVLHVDGQQTPWSTFIITATLNEGPDGWRMTSYQRQQKN